MSSSNQAGSRQARSVSLLLCTSAPLREILICFGALNACGRRKNISREGAKIAKKKNTGAQSPSDRHGRGLYINRSAPIPKARAIWQLVKKMALSRFVEAVPTTVRPRTAGGVGPGVAGKLVIYAPNEGPHPNSPRIGTITNRGTARREWRARKRLCGPVDLVRRSSYLASGLPDRTSARSGHLPATGLDRQVNRASVAPTREAGDEVECPHLAQREGRHRRVGDGVDHSYSHLRKMGPNSWWWSLFRGRPLADWIRWAPIRTRLPDDIRQ